MRFKNPFAFRPGPVTFWTTIIYLAVFIPLIYVHETVPPTPSSGSLQRGLNLTEAWHDLQTITQNYHPYNSHENDRVREYIIDRSKEILERNGVGYSVESLTAGSTWHDSSDRHAGSKGDNLVTLFDDQVSNFTRTRDDPKFVRTSGTYFEGNNFYVYIRGTEDPDGPWWATESGPEKLRRAGGVLVNCHFDSVSTGFGATDDGVACVSMLQLLSYFTSTDRQPKNGIVLLFNNAEEDGLLGAYAFIKSPVWEFAGTFVNLEGAGAGGRAILFRATDLEVAKAYSRSPHPFGSTIAADAFKTGVIRSGTDYSVFDGVMGQRGLDIAFYGPRARYHTDQDDTRHTSVRSIWHMLSAALASTERLSQTSSTVFVGDRADGNEQKVQNGRPTRGVWFDILGSAWATLELKGLFAWSLSLLIATPLILALVTYLLARKDKYYLFARDIKLDSDMHDEPVRIGGWKGLFRFPLALVFAGGLTIASVLLIAKFNPLIVYSSPYAIWSMTISLFYFAFWLIMRGSSFVRPSALQRAYVLLWLFILGWAIQVLAAVAEDRWKIGSLYFTAFLHTAIFLALFISLLELSALPGKQDFARQLHDADQTGGAEEEGDSRSDEAHRQEGTGNEEGDDESESATETTPLRGGGQGYGANNNQTTFASRYRQSVSTEAPSAPTVPRRQPYASEQSWSGYLPQWTWIIQFLLLAPFPLLLIGNLGLVAMTSLAQTAVDGSSLLLPSMSIGVVSIFLLLPLTPFIHRVTHHIPIFLLAVFAGTFIYNLTAFPFSIGNRYKFYFQQLIDLDEGSNVVRLSGLEDFVRPVIASLPSAGGQKIECTGGAGAKSGLDKCEYDATSLRPDVAAGRNLSELIWVDVPESINSPLVSLSIDAANTRMCVLTTSRPIYGFSVEGGSARDERLGSLPKGGFSSIDIWRRSWEGAWNMTFDLEKKSSVADDESPVVEEEVFDELKARSDETVQDDPFEVTVRCKWSDANDPKTIPALHELRQYMPSWAAVTKSQVGLVEVKKTFSIG